jgi:ABC-type nitrate/sulfonate/bicarbonate transport system substrate-binding protein
VLTRFIKNLKATEKKFLVPGDMKMEKKQHYLIITVIAIIVIGIALVLLLNGSKTGNPTPVVTVSGTPRGGISAPVLVQTSGIPPSKESTLSGSGLFIIRTPASSSDSSAINLADELGYYRDAGIVIEYTGVTSGGPESIMTVVAGSNDVGSSAFSAIVNAVAKGAKIKVIVPSQGTSVKDPAYKWFVLDNGPIKTASDLKGKTIAVNTLGAQADYVTRAYLYSHNLSPSDVQLVVLPYGNHEQVLRQGQVDVIAPSGNWVKKIEAGGGVRTLFTDAEVTGDQIKTGTFMSSDFIAKHPDIARKFVNATATAIEWDKLNRNQSRIVLAKFLKEHNGNPELASYFTGWSIGTPPVIHDSDVQFWIDVIVKEGTLKSGQLKPSDIYTNEFNPYFKG